MRVKLLIFFLFLNLFFLTPVHAIEITTPHTVEQLNINFEQYGAVSISQGNIQYIAINISTFQNSENQKVTFFNDPAFVTDEFKNERIFFQQKPDNLQLIYSVKGSAEISGKHTYDMPSSYSLAGINSAYLGPTKNIQSDNREISELARNITAGGSGDFEKAARIAIWIHANVNYTLDLGNMAKDAVWVLNNRIGTCDEFSTLFIAMARSVGIPAKYVSGWVYGNAGWQKHAWAEVYTGKWVPVDATWLEVGSLDATHIKLMETADNYVANQATALGTDLGDIKWLGDNANISAISMRESSAMPSEFFSSISSGKSGTLGLGKSAIIGLKINPKEYLVERFTIAPCKGMDIVRIENEQQDTILFPGRQNIILWKVSANENLGAGSIYTCPIAINSRFFGKQVFELTVDPRVKDSLDLSLTLDKYVARVNENLMAAVNARNANRKGAIIVGIASENGIVESGANLNDAPETSAEFNLYSGGIGKHTVYAFSDRGDVTLQNYDVYEIGNVFIDKIVAPEFAMLNEPLYVEVYLANNRHSEASAKLSVKLNGANALDETNMIPPKFTHLMNLTIPSDKIGNLRLSFRLVSDSIEEKLADVRVYNVSRLLLEGSYDSGAKAAVLKITPIGDDAKDIEATIDGQKNVLAGAKENVPLEMAFNLAAGTYNAKIIYSDVAGNKHEISQKIDFKKKGLFDIIKEFFARIFSMWN